MASVRTVVLQAGRLKGTSITYDYTGLDKALAKLKGKHVKIISDGVKYGIYWELGHTTSRGNFQQYPFLVPSVEEWRKPLKDALKNNLDKGNLLSVDDVVLKVAHGVETSAKRRIMGEIGSGKDLIDTGALYNSIAVHDPEDM